MAIDEAILEARAYDQVPDTLRLYTWRPSAVSIGYFQGLREEVNLSKCRQLGMDVVRRITGGGAVVHDSEGELTYSIVVGQEERLRDFLRSYRALASGLVYALRSLGLQAEFQGVNDITVCSRKISGNAQTRRKGTILQHGTLLIKTSPELISSVLKSDPEKLRLKGISSPGARVTSVMSELGTVSFESVVRAVEEGFREAMGDLESDELTDGELRLAEKLTVEKYMNPSWNERR